MGSRGIHGHVRASLKNWMCVCCNDSVVMLVWARRGSECVQVLDDGGLKTSASGE